MQEETITLNNHTRNGYFGSIHRMSLYHVNDLFHSINASLSTIILNVYQTSGRITDKLSRYLSLQVGVAIVLGILTGLYYPAFAIKTQVLATVFVAVIRPFVGPVIFLSVMIIFAGTVNLKTAGRITLKSLVYFELVTVLAILFGMGSAVLIHPGRIDATAIKSVFPSGFKQVSSGNWLMQNYSVILLATAVGAGLILSKMTYSARAVFLLDSLRKRVFILLRYIFLFAPVAAFGGIAYTVGKYGLETLLPIGKMLACTYITQLVFIATVFAALLALCKVNIFDFIASLKQELLWVLGTSSSSSVLPMLMAKLESMGYKRSVVGLVTVMGNTFNLAGTGIYMGIAVIFLGQLYDITFSSSEIFGILLVMMVTTKSATGIPGTGFIALATTIGSIHKVPLEGLAILFSIDRFMSEARAITNTVSHGVATVVISYTEKRINNIK
jgi:aerobic C4-dicarboxylate transport protein